MRLARRATRRLPLGEPPLVVTTHVITSFTLSLPGPAGVQPRAEAGSSPSYHARTPRAGPACVTAAAKFTITIRAPRAMGYQARKAGFRRQGGSLFLDLFEGL